jgi:hypothetical protein
MVGQNKYLAKVMGQRRVWVVALLFLLVIACEVESVKVDPTSTISDTATPGVTAVAGTELPQPTNTATPSASTVTGAELPRPTSTATRAAVVKGGTESAPVSTATATISPEISDTPVETPPPYHFETSDEALAAANELGCTGFATATVSGVFFYRACAEDERFEFVTAGIAPDAESTSAPAAIAVLPTAVAPPEIVSTVEFNPPIAQNPTSTTTPPPYHFETIEEALAGAEEIGCSGWQGVSIGLVLYYRACGNTDTYDQLASGSGVTLSGSPCAIESDPTARFTKAPTDLSLIRSILSSGTAAGGVIKPHSYLFNHHEPGEGRVPVRVPVYAVADSFVNAIAYYTEGTVSEYLIFFDVTCEISFKFDHIAELAPRLLAVAPQTPSQGSHTSPVDLLPMKAGELIGYTSGAGGIGPWDFGAYDLTFTNQFANQDRYVKGGMTQTLHTVCPYEYFGEPLRSEMLAKIGTYSSFVVGDPTCHTTERDVLGAATGAWFDNTDISTFSDAKLSIALTEGYAVGITGVGSGLKLDKGDPTWLDPDLLTTSHCYADDGRWFYIEIQASGMQLALANGSGTCPASLPAGATIYYR